MMDEVEHQEQVTRGHPSVVFAILLSAITCGGTFLFALYRQLALVEVAASLAVGVELYLLSASVGDWIENRPAPSRSRAWTALGLAGAIVSSFLIARFLKG